MHVVTAVFDSRSPLVFLIFGFLWLTGSSLLRRWMPKGGPALECERGSGVTVALAGPKVVPIDRGSRARTPAARPLRRVRNA